MNPALTPPVLSCAEAAEFEQGFFGGNEKAEWAAMNTAGRAVAEGILRDFREIGEFPAGGKVLVLAGKGHNGGDALIAVGEMLRRHPGARAEVVFVFGERGLRPLAARAWQELAGGAGGPRDRVTVVRTDRLGHGEGNRYDVAVDGVFGFQFRPPLPAAAAAVMRRVNAMEIRLRAAVDLPSGGDEKDGFRADFTYATGAVKAPVLEWKHAGRVRYLDLGFFAPERDVAGAHDRVLTTGVLEPLRRLRPAHGDKRTYGHIFILGGSRSYPGAVMMNVLAALHSGVGLVTVFVPESLAAAYAARAPEAMWVGWPETPAGGLAMEGRHLWLDRIKRATAIAIGSGMAREPETIALAREVVAASEVPVLLDGDGLQEEVVRAARAPLALTPHAGEFERIAGGKDLREFCAGTGATVALKGPVTRVCSGLARDEMRPKGKAATESLRVYCSLFGGPVLARGGSGDILAGLTAGQLAMLHAAKSDGHRELDLEPATLLAACRGVVWHGMAADALARARGATSATVTQMVDFLPQVLRG